MGGERESHSGRAQAASGTTLFRLTPLGKGSRTDTCVSYACHPLHAWDTSPWTLATCADLRRDLLLREPESRRPRSRREKAKRAASPARIRVVHPASCMDRLLLAAGHPSVGEPKPSRASRKACIAACGRSLIRTPAIRCSRLLYGRRCVLASAAPCHAGSGRPLRRSPRHALRHCPAARVRACEALCEQTLAVAGRGAAVSCSARSTC